MFTVLLAPTVALAAWALIRLTGVDLVVSTGSGKVGPGDVFAAALFAALAAWAAARVLERRIRRPRAWWSFAASTALAVSVVGPSWLADGSSAVALIALHLVTAVVVIGGFVETIPVQGRANPRKSTVPRTSTP
jgi:hypothetical protein